MIDAANFKPQGKPTRMQVRAIYEQSHGEKGEAPTVDTVHETLTQRGFSIGRATVARWIKLGFKEPAPRSKSVPLDDQTEAFKKATTLKRMPGTEDGSADKEPAPKQTGIEAAIAPPVEEIKLMARLARMRELMGLSEPQVAEIESKIRRVYNIVLLEESIEIADRLATIPKDNSLMVVAQSESIAKTTVMMPDPTAPGAKPQRFDPNNPRVIDHQQAVPVDPLSAAITNFLQKEGMEAA